MNYDIHTDEAALETLQQMTGITTVQWETNLYRERNYQFLDDFVEAMIQEFGTKSLPKSYRDMDFVFFHITTSADQCASIRRNGILDLQEAYLCEDSELRKYLDNHGVFINLNEETLTYDGRVFDIHYGERPRYYQSFENRCWSVARKFYYDYTVCGFLSAWSRNPYGGMVHKRPEVLSDIDELLGTRLSQEWERTHTTYKIVAKASGRNICYPYDDDSPEDEKIMTYMVMAYKEAFNGNSENILLMKNRIQIPANDILEITPFDSWD